jgi:hypothetical protein
MRFRDFLRVSVLLFGGAATALAVVSIAGATRRDDRTLLYLALGWWVVAAIAGLWLGRRRSTPAPGIARLLAGARKTTTLPELEPGSVMFNRLWPLALLTVGAGALGLFLPQVPAVATGYSLLMALSWRNQSSAVVAIEQRDGIEFWFERSSPFGPPQLLRLPGLRKIEPVVAEPDALSTRA